MPTPAERLAALEARQKGHEEKVAVEIANLSTRIDDVQSKQEDTHAVLVGMGQTLNVIKSGIEAKQAAEDAVKGDRRSKKLDLNAWIIILIGAGTMIFQGAPLFIKSSPSPVPQAAYTRDK